MRSSGIMQACRKHGVPAGPVGSERCARLLARLGAPDFQRCTPGDAVKRPRVTNRLNYLHDEWLNLARAPLAVMTAVMSAGQTSAVQIAKELVAIQQALRATREATGGAELIQALIVETEAEAAEHFQRESETPQFARAQERVRRLWRQHQLQVRRLARRRRSRTARRTRA